ncbi:hypothetical protein M427DRAFT_149622 [Gonapodya prolifera JEL478]|uniref:Uncharacterized protein n=1 Tax=Gonapodya prolifera (strain JEL478) TaxID=1344416 RepID=A0A138ZYU3_GONPJ|nr:hypothetical protein M427DRAFT_149622 [Gonapodya prolifera JEL478]|eukprot:KXS09677.1 hypothetical protein M427DRAFT_149622 [Gonapodya prolifera JEL478]
MYDGMYSDQPSWSGCSGFCDAGIGNVPFGNAEQLEPAGNETTGSLARAVLCANRVASEKDVVGAGDGREWLLENLGGVMDDGRWVMARSEMSLQGRDRGTKTNGTQSSSSPRSTTTLARKNVHEVEQYLLPPARGSLKGLFMKGSALRLADSPPTAIGGADANMGRICVGPQIPESLPSMSPSGGAHERGVTTYDLVLSIDDIEVVLDRFERGLVATRCAPGSSSCEAQRIKAPGNGPRTSVNHPLVEWQRGSVGRAGVGERSVDTRNSLRPHRWHDVTKHQHQKCGSLYHYNIKPQSGGVTFSLPG